MNMVTRRGLTILLLLSAGLLWAASRSPIVLRHANSLQSSEENGVRKQVLTGEVWITKDSLNVTCQNAVYYPDSGLLIFRDNVEFKDPRRTLFADEVIYNEFTDEVLASNRVRIYQSDSLSATSRTARYRERFRQAYLYDDVHIREENRKVQLSGDLGYLDHDRLYGWVTGDPVLVQRDSLKRIVTEIYGDTISYDDRQKRAQAIGSVRVLRDSLRARGQTLEYFTEDRFAELLGKPSAIRGQDTTRGDSMRMFFEGEKLDRVEVLGHAIVTSPADSGATEPLNEMTGKKMTLWMDSTGIQEVLVEGTATAIYFVRESGRPQGRNVTSGDRIRVFFDGRRISRIRVEGGTEGDYTPQNLLSSEEDTQANPKGNP